MKVLFLTHRRDTPSTRYRVLQFFDILEREGIEASAVEADTGWLQRLKTARSASTYDAVVIQKKLLSRPFLSLLRRRCRALIYDLDDAIYLGRDGPSRTRRSRFAAVVRAADLVLAGNRVLASEATAAGSKRVEVVPTGLDPDAYTAAGSKQGIVLGWLGSGGNVPYLETIVPAIAAAAAREATIRLRVISDRFPVVRGVELEQCLWSAETEPRDLAGVDIGLAPLPDDPWTRGKCGFKILQCMAASLPVIASPVGAQSELVEPGRTGLLAQTAKEWTSAILELASDPVKRRRMGQAGRKKLEAGFTRELLGKRLAALLRSVCQNS